MKLTAEDLRPEVLQFALLMEAKLREHDDRPGWKQETIPYLWGRLQEEVREMQDYGGYPTANTALQTNLEVRHASEKPSTIVFGWADNFACEAADVANFAMMIADVCGVLYTVAEKVEERRSVE